MTLIAMATNYGNPFTTADVLITSKIGKTDVVLPYRPVPLSPEELKDLVYKPSRFLQKIYVIQPNISLCVAGDVLLLKRMIQKFKSFCKIKSNNGMELLTMPEVAKFFGHYNKAELEKMACGVSIVQEFEGIDIVLHAEFGNWEVINSPDFETVSASGTGKTQYIKHIAKQNSFGSSHRPGDFLYAMQMTFSFIAKLLAKERKTLKSLENYWGAFLETCYYNGNSFEKVGGIAFVICDAQCEAEGYISLPQPQLFIYSQYIGNVLYLTAVETEDLTINKTDESIEFTSIKLKRTLFAIEEIDSPIDSVLLKNNADLSFHSNDIAMGLNLYILPNIFLPMGFYTAGADVSVEFVDGKQIKFTWPVHMQNKMEEQIMGS